jgi:hypothetical protein
MVERRIEGVALLTRLGQFRMKDTDEAVAEQVVALAELVRTGGSVLASGDQGGRN